MQLDAGTDVKVSWLRDHNGEVVHGRPAFKELVDIQGCRTLLWIEHIDLFACCGDYNERVNIWRRDARRGYYETNRRRNSGSLCLDMRKQY